MFVLGYRCLGNIRNREYSQIRIRICEFWSLQSQGKVISALVGLLPATENC